MRLGNKDFFDIDYAKEQWYLKKAKEILKENKEISNFILNKSENHENNKSSD